MTTGILYFPKVFFDYFLSLLRKGDFLETAAIQLKNLTKTFGSVVANDHVSLEIRHGEILALLGENGSGKTTLMNMLSGIYYPDGGEIFVNGKEVIIDNPRDAFAIAEIMLGYSINTENPDELRAAADKLVEQKQNNIVQAYVMDEIFDKMGAKEAVVAPYYAGDAVTLMQDYEHLGFVIPESGTNRFVDAVCIPKTSQKIEAAQMYINFLCEPEIALSNSTYIGYSTPNQATYELLDEEIKNDGISYLDDGYLNNKTTIFYNLSDEANQLMQDLWVDIKSFNN